MNECALTIKRNAGPMKRFFRCAIPIVAVVLTPALRVHADWVEHFDGSYSTFFWSNLSDNGSTNWSADLSQNYLHLEATGGDPTAFPTQSTNIISGAAGPGAVFGLNPLEVFTDVEMAGWVNLNPEATLSVGNHLGSPFPVTGNNGQALLLRGNPLTLNGYTFSANLGWGSLQVGRVDAGVGSVLAESANFLFTSSDTLYLVFRALGTNLDGWAYTDDAMTNQIGHVSFSDNTYALGASGVIGWFAASAPDPTVLNATFDEVSAIVIPEPMTLCLLVVGGLFLAGCCSRTLH